MYSARAHLFSFSGIGSAVCLLILVSALNASGQSVRRGSKVAPVSLPTPEVKAPEKKPVEKDQPKLNLIVGIDRGGGFGSIPSYYYDSVLEGCSARLQDSSGVRLDVVPREMTRSDAVKRAKGEHEGYVIWLGLRAEGNSPDSLYIGYTVLEPTTAKLKIQGHAYQDLYRQGSIAIPGTSGRATSMLIERRLREAAQDAAEKILKAFHSASPSGIPPH